MKLLFTIWISVVLIQEVFSSALVRYPRHAVSKPTSSVHTEYEATYEQKGKHGNGSYSTVSGKQEVVHDNCHDNWNAFADKCATLIKDLVASLGNAVSSKPGDATNLQLRIRNTFKHFDSTDNCTCFTKNSLTSLFDNVTASSAQPVVIQEEIIPSAQNVDGNSGQVQSRTCEGGSCNEESGSDQKVLSTSQQRRGQPSLTLTHAEEVDPENADTSKESSTTNSRRGVEYPAVIVQDPSQRSRGSGAAVSKPKQSSPTSGSSSNIKKILSPAAKTSQSAPALAKVIESPPEIVVPTPQSQSSAKTQPLKPATSSRTPTSEQSSFQSASPVYRPAKNNGIVRSAIPVRSFSSASDSSSPEAAAIRSPNALNDAESGPSQTAGVLSDAITPLEVPVQPIKEVVPVNGEETPTESNAASNQTPFVVPEVLTEPVNSAAAKPQSDSSISSAPNGASAQIPRGISESEPALDKPEIISIKSEGGKEEDFNGENGSESSQAVPIAVPVAEPGTIPVKSEGNKEEDYNEEKGSESSQAVPVAESVAEPGTIPVKSEGNKEEDYNEEKDSESSQAVPVAEPGTIPVKSEGNKEEDYNEEKGSESSQAVPIAEPETISIKSKGDKEEDYNEEKDSESSQAVPVAESVAEPEIISIKSEGGKEEDFNGENGSESSQAVPVAEPGTIPVKSEGNKEEDYNEEKGSESSQAVPIAEPETISIKSKGDKEEDYNEEKDSESSQAVPVAEPETISIKSKGDKEEDYNEEKGSESSQAVPIAESVAKPETISIKSKGDKEEDYNEEKDSESSQAVPVAELETVSIKSEGDKEEDCDEEKASEGSESIPVAEPVSGAATEPVNFKVAEPETIPVKSVAEKEENYDEEDGSESEQIPVVSPVISAPETQVTSTSDDEGAAGNGSNQRPVVKPVTSTFQDPSTIVSNGNTNSASNPKSSVVPAMPVSDSGDSKMPVITQAADSTNQEPLSISDDPEIASSSDSANVNPGLVVKQPQSQLSNQKNPSAKLPLINSNSNLPDSTGPVDSARNVSPSPIYRSLPTAPSAIPSSDSAVSSNKPQQPTNKQEVSKPSANARDKTTQSGSGQSISSVKETSVPPAAASQRSQGKGGKEAGEKVFIVTPVPVYPEKVFVKPGEQVEESSKNGSPSKGSEPMGTDHTEFAKGGGALDPKGNTLQAGNGQQENLLTTPIPVIPVVAKEHNGDASGHSASGKPSLQQHPLFNKLGNQKSAGNQPKQITGEPEVLRLQSPFPKVVKVPVVNTAEDEDLTKATTFQTTSTDPTPPQQSIQSPPLKNSVSLTRPTSVPQESFETPHGAPATSPRAPHDDDDDDDEEEDCCSCESCTEEVTNPKQYKEMACKDLEEARKELKAIFDKIKKRLKCGKKAPPKIVAS